MQFMTVASIPMESAFVRSMVSLLLPRQKLPPPMTIATCVPPSTSVLICFATSMQVASSKPVFFSPAKASPLNFNKILAYVLKATSLCGGKRPLAPHPILPYRAYQINT